MNLLDALAEFSTAKATKLSPKTIEWYGIWIRAFAHWLEERIAAGTISADDWLQPATFEQYYAYLAAAKDAKTPGRGLQPASVAGAHRSLHVFFGWLSKRKRRDGATYLPWNPLTEVETPHVPRRQPRRTTPDEYERLLQSIPLANNWIDLRDYLMVSTLFLCGIRVSELCRLKIKDYDVLNRLIIVRKKGGDDHLVPMLEPVMRAFVAYLYSRPAWAESYVFLSSDGWKGADGVLSTNGVRQRLTQLCERAGVKRLTPHKFRHGLARYMLDKGADMSLIQRILGHQRVSTTADIYALWDNLEGVTAQYKAIMTEITQGRHGRQPNEKSK
jgi:integrase/recombinase XerD